MQTKKRNNMYIIMKSKKDDVQLFNLWANTLLIYIITLCSELSKYMKVYVIRPKYMYLLVTQSQILKTLTNLGMFFLLYKLSCGSKHFSLFDNGVSCKVLQHHFELAVPASDIYLHGAKGQVAALPIFFSLPSQL